MSSNQRHIIRSKEFRFKSENEADAKRWQKLVGERVNNNDFLDRLSRMFDDLVPDNQLVQLDQLEVRMELDEKDFEKNLLEAIREGLKIQLSDKDTSSQPNTRKGKLEAIFHFLSKGFFPWWSNASLLKEEIETVIQNEIGRVKLWLKGKPAAIIRLADHVSIEFITAHLLSAQIKAEHTETIIRFFEQVFRTVTGRGQRSIVRLIKRALIETSLLDIDKPNSFAKALIKNLFTKLSYSQIVAMEGWYQAFVASQDRSLDAKSTTGSNNDEVELSKIFEALPASVKRRLLLMLDSTEEQQSRDRNLPSDHSAESGKELTEQKANTEQVARTEATQEHTKSQYGDAENQKAPQESVSREELQEALTEGIFLQHAGLILLHPFLPRLFKEMELLNEKAFKDAQSQQQAIQMLGWLATGNDELGEEELVMAKLLTGFPLFEPLDIIDSLFEKQTELGTELLQAVLQHWTVLGNSSIEGLREGFLMREGKLTHGDQGYRLTIERKTLDILLNKLPWGIGMTKLPWCQETIFTDWN